MKRQFDDPKQAQEVVVGQIAPKQLLLRASIASTVSRGRAWFNIAAAPMTNVRGSGCSITACSQFSRETRCSARDGPGYVGIARRGAPRDQPGGGGRAAAARERSPAAHCTSNPCRRASPRAACVESSTWMPISRPLGPNFRRAVARQIDQQRSRSADADRTTASGPRAN